MKLRCKDTVDGGTQIPHMFTLHCAYFRYQVLQSTPSTVGWKNRFYEQIMYMDGFIAVHDTFFNLMDEGNTCLLGTEHIFKYGPRALRDDKTAMKNSMYLK